MRWATLSLVVSPGMEHMSLGIASMLRAELSLSDARAHDSGGGETTRDNVAHLIHNLRAAPLLMRQRLDLVLALLTLNELDICCRTLCGVGLRKEVDAEGIAVEACQGDELPAEAKLGQIPNEGFHLRISHAGAIPVEGGAQVVCEHCVRRLSFHVGCE